MARLAQAAQIHHTRRTAPLESRGVSFIHACPGFVATSWGTEMPWLVKRLVRALQRFGRSKEDAGESLGELLEFGHL